MKTYLFITCALVFFVGYALQADGQTNTPLAATFSSGSAKVPVDVAHRMVANYAPRAGFVERDGEQLPNTRTVWFSLAQLKAFINEIEGDGGDGIRFYFAAYDDSYPDGGVNAEVPPQAYWGYNTLLMVPTRDSTANGITYHRDYLTGISQSGGRPSNLMRKSTVENRGMLCPPSCGDDPALLKGADE
ncbi:hypothetical protein [Parapedobacter sp. 10938]|uniref:hypothetical protein n=1 Tax=Parapedobacter flavus TaxID=3110225 RepID=UPI002DB64AAC|nr:hypothetical protein [Parapedobacter sp. 10938]MEC3879130.1 hypothetical protein [Parapedobacter sp. 10938]